MSSGLGQRLPKRFPITVASGEGTSASNLILAGDAIGYQIQAPNQVVTYDIEFKGTNDEGLSENLSNTGNTTVKDEFQLHYDHKSNTGPTVTISNASVDGTFYVKVMFKG